MDWEKKTVARASLREAAADVFNDTKTPGQALLSALETAETVRVCIDAGGVTRHGGQGTWALGRGACERR